MPIADRDQYEIPPDTQSSIFKKSMYPLLLFAFSFIIYANTIPNYYNLDDELVTKKHKYTSQGFSGIKEILTSPYYSDDMGYSYDYRPVVHISFAIEHQLFGESPHVSHFFNALLFACLCVLLFFLLKTLLPASDILIFIAIALFSSHPIHTEVVASIKNRDELLMMFFSSLSLYIYLKWVDKMHIIAISLAFTLFTLSMLSKSTALPFAFVIPLSVAFFHRISISKYLLLSTVLVCSAVFFLGNTQLIFKLKIGLFITAANIAVYYLIRHHKVVTDYLKKQRYTFNVAGANDTITNDINTILFSLPKGGVLLQFIFVCTVILLTAYSLFAGVQWLSYIGLVICVLFILVSKNRNNIWFIIPFFAITLLVIQRYDTSYHVLSIICLFTLAISAYLSYGYSRIILIILLVIFSAHWYFISGKLLFLCLIAFIGLLLPEKIKRKAVFVICGVLVIDIVDTLIVENDNLKPFLWALSGFSLIILSYIWYYKSYRPVIFFRLLATVFLLAFTIETFTAESPDNEQKNIFSYTNQNRYNNINSTLSTSINNLNAITIHGPVAISTERPLNVVETPVSLNAPLKTKVTWALSILLHYDKLLLIPHPLIFYYGYNMIKPVDSFTPLIIFSLLLHFTLLVVALLVIRNYPIISWAIILYLGFLATLSNIFISIPGIIGERYLLVPSLAYCVLLAGLILGVSNYISEKSSNGKLTGLRIAKWLTVSIVVLYSFGTMSRNSLWKTDITLFSHDIKNAPESAQAHNLLAIHLIQKSLEITDVNEQVELRKTALRHYSEAQRIYPKMFNVAYDMARAYAMLNMNDSAVATFLYASTLDSSFFNVQLSIAEIYYYEAKYDSAAFYLEYVIRKIPDYYPAYEKLSHILFLQRNFDRYMQINRQAINQMPKVPEPYINMAHAFVSTNKLDSARYYVFKAATIAPQNQIVQQMATELGAIP